jgi:hypothetical protein
MLHCNNSRYCVTLVSNSSINPTHKNTAKKADGIAKRAAKFGDEEVQKKGRSSLRPFAFGGEPDRPLGHAAHVPSLGEAPGKRPV